MPCYGDGPMLSHLPPEASTSTFILMEPLPYIHVPGREVVVDPRVAEEALVDALVDQVLLKVLSQDSSSSGSRATLVAGPPFLAPVVDQGLRQRLVTEVLR